MNKPCGYCLSIYKSTPHSPRRRYKFCPMCGMKLDFEICPTCGKKKRRNDDE